MLLAPYHFIVNKNIISSDNFITCTNFKAYVHYAIDKKLNNNDLKWIFFVQNFNDLNHMQIDNVVKLYIIMTGIQAIKGSWRTLMNEINKTI